MKGIGIKKEEIKSIFYYFHNKHKEMRDILLDLIKESDMTEKAHTQIIF